MYPLDPWAYDNLCSSRHPSTLRDACPSKLTALQSPSMPRSFHSTYWRWSPSILNFRSWIPLRKLWSNSSVLAITCNWSPSSDCSTTSSRPNWITLIQRMWRKPRFCCSCKFTTLSSNTSPGMVCSRRMHPSSRSSSHNPVLCGQQLQEDHDAQKPLPTGLGLSHGHPKQQPLECVRDGRPQDHQNVDQPWLWDEGEVLLQTPGVRVLRRLVEGKSLSNSPDSTDLLSHLYLLQLNFILDELLCSCLVDDCYCLSSKDYVIAFYAKKLSLYRTDMFPLEDLQEMSGSIQEDATRCLGEGNH